jgi:hypothetical protein
MLSLLDFNAAPFSILDFQIFKEGPEITTKVYPNRNWKIRQRKIPFSFGLPT